MPDRRLLRALGLIFGRAYASRWVVGRAASWVAGGADERMRWWGVAEAGLGLAMLAKAPFGSYTGVDRSEDMFGRARAKSTRVANVQLQQSDLVAAGGHGHP